VAEQGLSHLLAIAGVADSGWGTSMKLMTFVAAALAIANPAGASAATIIATYTGTIHAGTDQADYFGKGSNFQGSDVTLVFEFDPGFGAFVTDGTTYQRRSEINGSNLLISATATIDGVTKNLLRATGSSMMERHTSHYEHHYGQGERIFSSYQSSEGDPRVGTYVESRLSGEIYEMYGNPDEKTIFDTLDLAAPLNYAPVYGDTASGSFVYLDSQQGVYRERIIANFTISNLTISSASPVPEPATWAFMIVGFGVIGGAMRAGRGRTGAGKGLIVSN